jgi:hypothetical protein
MPVNDDTVICVQGEWDGWKTGEVRLRDLQNIHWRQPIHAPRLLVHGYIRCTDLITGEIPHVCDRSGTPHRLLVCVIKRHSAPSAFEELVRRAGPQVVVNAQVRQAPEYDDVVRAAAFDARKEAVIGGAKRPKRAFLSLT